MRKLYSTCLKSLCLIFPVIATLYCSDALSQACTTPPMPGNAVVTTTLPVCPGSPVTLDLSGNSAGSGQTYTWQTSSTATGTYIDVGSASASSEFIINPTATVFYRAAVTCSGNTGYSVPVEVLVNDPLAGHYTINPGLPAGNRNYQSLTEAINALSCGISAAVVFDVAIGSGPYTEQIIIPAITGASATNTITFNGYGATIQETPVSAKRQLIQLDGADYIIIKNFRLQSQSTTYGWGVHLTNGADHNMIDSCTIDLSGITSTSQSNSAGIVISGSSTSVTLDGSASYNIFSNNTIIGAYQGIILTGTDDSADAVGNMVTGNTLQDFYAMGIMLTDNDSSIVSYNNISRANRSSVTTFTGIELGIGNKNIIVNANRIHDTHNAASSQSGSSYGIYLTGCDAPAGSENKVINNLIYNFNSNTGTIYALYNSSSDSVQYYHNTIVLDNGSASSGTTRGFYQTTAASGIELKNNIFYISRGGSGTKYCLYFGTTSSEIVSNKNVLHQGSPSGTNGIGYFSSGFETLSEWKTANSNLYDQQSVDLDPQFVNPGAGDYTPGMPFLNDIGDNVGVATDIDGDPRNVNSPDPGAFEFSLAPCINPPIAGSAVSTATIVCPGETFTLNLLNNSIGDAQTYQWQSSPDNSTWTNVNAPATITSLITSQTLTSYYRAAVTCGSGTSVYSDTILVMTPALVSGTFSINSSLPTSGTNFQTFTDAVRFIKCGINGPVTFNVEPGTSYNEQVIIPQIAGTSAVNTITFNGNGSILSYLSSSSSERATLKLQGADHVIIDSLQIMAIGSQGTEYGYAVQLVDDANNNMIRNCIISATTTPSSASSSDFAGLVINESAASTPIAAGNSLCDSNIISDNKISGGYVGIAAVADGNSSIIHGNKIINNSIQDFYTYGIYINGNDSTLIENNDISRPSRSGVGTFYGINLNDININTLISKNRIHNPFDGNSSSSSAAYGIRFTNADAGAGSENVVSNNMIYAFTGGKGTQNGIINNASDYARYYYNSVLIDDAGASCNCDARGLYVDGTTVINLDIRNNIFSVGRGGTGDQQALYLEPSDISSYTIDHNNYYLFASGGTVETVHMGNSGYPTLADWQAAGTMDAHSFNIDPLFMSPGDLHLQSASTLDDKGMAIATITTDIDGDTRDGGTPDIGADELPLATGLDIKPSMLLSPAVTKGCYNADSIIVRIKNNSTAVINFTANPLTVTVNVAGTATAVFTTIVNTGTLAAGTTMDVAMTTPSATLDMTANGTYSFSVSTLVVGDVNTANDLLPVETRTRTTLTAGTIAASPDNYCVTGGAPMLIVTDADGYSSIQWQQSTTSGSGFTDIVDATTSPYTLTDSITQTMYYQLVASCGTNTLTSSEVSVAVNNPQVISTTPATRCGPGPVTIGATASTNATLNWYVDATGGMPLATGATYNADISATTTYYVSASVGGTSEDMPSPTAGTSQFYSDATGWGLRFTVNTPVTINSVVMYPSSFSAGPASLQVRITDLSDVVLYTGALYNFTVGTDISQETVPVGVRVPPGDYKMVMSATGIDDLVRESGGVSFPYTAASNAVSITAGANGTGTSQTTSGYYWFYDWQISTGCESGRTPVTATVTIPPAITASATMSTICTGQNTDLTVTSPNDPHYIYSWTPGNLTGASQTVSPGATTTYTVTATDNSGGANNGCVNIADVIVAVNPVPPPIDISPSSVSICTGSPAQQLTTGDPSPSSFAFGTQTNQNTASTGSGGYPAPYSIYYGGQRMQMLILASELTTAGIQPGTAFNEIKFPVVSMGSDWGSSTMACKSFKVSIGTTTLTSLSNFQGGLTEVVAAIDFTPTVGYSNTHTFSAPFIWDGTSNIIIETTFSNDMFGASGDLVTQYNSPTSFASTIVYRADNISAAAAASATSVSYSYNARPDFQLNGIPITDITWAPVTGLFTDAAATIPYTGTATNIVYANPPTATVYTATVTNTLGCSANSSASVVLNQPPSIANQPLAQSVCPGADVTFNVLAQYGISYQWQKDNIDINGATGSSYTIHNAGDGDVGNYTVKVIGNCGTIISDLAALTLKVSTVITTQPIDQGVCPGGDVTLSVTADGTDLTYQWRKDAVNIGNANSSSYTISGADVDDVGSYDVVITGDCGTLTSDAVDLSLSGITITTQPVAQEICKGSAVTFSAAATGAGLSYQWRKDGVDINGAISSDYTINAATDTDAGDYDVVITGTCGTQTSSVAELTINPLTEITTQSSPQTVCPGDSPSFSVTATGTGALNYQWRKDGVDIQGANSSTYIINSVVTGDAGNYDVIVAGTCSSDTSAGITLTVNEATTIGTPPVAQTVCEGGNVTFNVAATGTGLTYQWRKDAVDINGAIASSYIITGATANDVGDYDVIVTGACGSVTSSVASLSMNTATVITAQPQPQTICAGNDITFSVAATGTDLTYQWRKDGVDIDTATSTDFTIAGVVVNDAGTYDVVVAGACGNITSTVAVLAVNAGGTWTGMTSSDWNTASNWCGTMPTAFTDVVIPALTPNMPELSAAGSARNITIDAGASLTIDVNGTLDLYGNITNDGTFDATAGNIIFSGSTSQTMPAFTTTNVTMNGNGGVILNGDAVINGTLTLGNGNITLDANTLTLAQTATGSTSAHIITGGTGQVLVAGLESLTNRIVPVGTDAASYNPVILTANATHTTDDFLVKVHKGVFVNGISGNQFTEYVVDKTWDITEASPGGSNVNITLQWSADDELPRFERERSYIMQHNGTTWLSAIETPAEGNNPYTQTKTGVTSFSSFAIQKQPIPDAPTGIYPNPVTSTLNVVVRPRQAEEMILSVYDASGKQLIVQYESTNPGANLLAIDVSRLVAGMYTLKVSTKRDKEFMVRKFLKVN